MSNIITDKNNANSFLDRKSIENDHSIIEFHKQGFIEEFNG